MTVAQYGPPITEKLVEDCQRELERLDDQLAELAERRQATARLLEALRAGEQVNGSAQTSTLPRRGPRKRSHSVNLLGVVRAHPGISAREAGEKVGILSGPHAHGVVKGLIDGGHLRREDGRLYAVGS